jgi:hypothetical protein
VPFVTLTTRAVPSDHRTEASGVPAAPTPNSKRKVLPGNDLHPKNAVRIYAVPALLSKAADRPKDTRV